MMKIGCCPTMLPYAKKIAKENNFELLNLGSAARVLHFLNMEEIDIGIIGRKAKKQEFLGYEKRIGNGYTLITNKKRMIFENQLENIEVHTNISKEIITEEFSELKNIIYHKTLQDALEKGVIQLICWDDWQDEFELLIPVDKSFNKNKKFRTPFLFTKKEELIKDI